MSDVLEWLKISSLVFWVLYVTRAAIRNSFEIEELKEDTEKAIEQNAKDIEVIVKQLQKNE